MGIIADKLRNSTTQASDVYTEMNNAWHEAQDQQEASEEDAAQAVHSSPSWWDMLVNGDVQGMANAIGLNDTKSGEPYVSARDNSDVPNVQDDGSFVGNLRRDVNAWGSTVAGDVSNVYNSGGTEGKWKLYEDAIADPAMKIAATPFIPGPARAAAGLVAAPDFISGVVNAGKQGYGDGEGGVIGGMAGVVNSLVTQPLEQLAQAALHPIDTAQSIKEHPGNLWNNVLEPGMVAEMGIRGGKKVYDNRGAIGDFASDAKNQGVGNAVFDRTAGKSFDDMGDSSYTAPDSSSDAIDYTEQPSSSQNTSGVNTGIDANVDAMVNDAAARNNVDPALLAKLVDQESTYGRDQNAGGNLAQVSSDLAARYGLDVNNPAQSIEAGARYLKEQLDANGGDAREALAAYNAGPGNKQAGYGYADSVLGRDIGGDIGAGEDAYSAGANAWIGERMPSGDKGCVEAATRVGSYYDDFLKQEADKGVSYVPTLVKDAGDRVIPFDASKLEKGDIIVYGDRDHVVTYDGNGGYVGNSTSQGRIVHGSDYREMGDLQPTEIIKTTDRSGGESSYFPKVDEESGVIDANNKNVDILGNKIGNDEISIEDQMKADAVRAVNGEDISKPAEDINKPADVKWDNGEETSPKEIAPERMQEMKEIDDYLSQLKNERQRMIDEEVNFYKDTPGGKGTQTGTIVDDTGRVTGRFSESYNPQWYQDAYKYFNGKPPKSRLAEFAEDYLSKNSEEFSKIDLQIRQLDEYRKRLESSPERPSDDIASEVFGEINYSKKNGNKYYKGEDINPDDIQPFNDITDNAKYEQLSDEFSKNGYNGQPIVVLDNANEGYLGLTGSHRIMAARKAGIDIPSIVLDNNEHTAKLYDMGDSERPYYAEELADEGIIPKEAADLFRIEDDNNFDDFKLNTKPIVEYSKPTKESYFDAAERGDYSTAAELARQAGKKEWADNFQLLADTDGGNKSPTPILSGKPNGEYTGDTVTMRQIMKRAQELFVPVRTGRLGMKGINGFANHKTGVIRVGTYGDIKTMSHEIGHIVDAALDLRGQAGAYDAEFSRVVNSRFGKGAYRPDEIRGEGIAEFMKDYLMNEESAKKNFPQYYDAFKKAIGENADIKGRVDELKSMMDTWKDQSSEARGRSSVSYADENKPTPKERLKNAWDSFVEGVVDDKDALQRAQEAFNDLSGKVADTAHDVYKQARLAMNSSIARAEMMVRDKQSDLIRNSLNKIYGEGTVGRGFKSLKNILTDLDKSVKGKYDGYLEQGGFRNWHEALDSLLVARRSIEIKEARIREAQDAKVDIESRILDYKQKLDGLLKTKAALSRQLLNDDIRSRINKANRGIAQISKEIDSLNISHKEAVKAELAARDYKTAVSMEDAKNIVKNAPDELTRAAKEVYTYNDAVLHIMQKTGMISLKNYNILKEKYHNYVPLARDFSDEAGIIQGFGMSGKGFANVAQAIKTLSDTGSTRQVRSPLESMVQNTFKLLSMAERNRVGQIFAGWAKTPKAGKLCEEVTGTAKQKDSTVSVWIDGEKHVYQTTPEIYRAIMSMNQNSSSMVIKMLSAPATLLRSGATLMPDFALKNIMRDSFGAAVFSRYGFRPVIDHAAGILHMVKQDQLFQDYKSSGALMSTMVGLDRDFLQASLKGLYKKDASYYWKNYNPVQILRGFSEMLETATRLGEYGRAVKKGASMEDAALSARDVSLDFSKAGKTGREINKISAFFNAGVQEPARIFQAFKENPKKTALKTAMYITLPSIALWCMNHDKDWYKEMPDWQKNIFWMFKAGDTVYRIPKPFGLGVIFGSLPERTLDWAYNKNPNAMKSWVKSARDSLMPNIAPTAIMPIIEWMANYSFFRGRNIVPGRLQKMPEAQQYGPNTSEMAKDIGRMFGLSPMKVDSLIQGYGAGMATQGLNAWDAARGHRMMDNPFKKAFTADPMKSPQSVQDFYDKLEESEKEYNGAGGKSGAKGNTKYNYQLMSHANKVMQDLNKQERAAVQAKDQNKIDIINAKQLKAAQDALKLYK